MATTTTPPPAARQPLLEPQQLQRYADAIVHTSLGLSPGDTLFVQAHPEHRELAVALAEAGYRAGARIVDMHYYEPRLQAARIRWADDDRLGPAADWTARRNLEQIKQTAATVTVLGDADPDVLAGLPPDRVARDTMLPLERQKRYVRETKAGRRRWVGAAWPTAAWAAQAYPELDADEARRRLASDVLWFCRLGPDDPPDATGWRDHIEALDRRARTLTGLALEQVELRGPGTSLDIRLVPETVWLGGIEVNAWGHRVAGNIPTEEVYTTPNAAATEGTFRCTRPLSFASRMIEGIAGEFRRGRLVRLEAADADERELLATFLHGEKNADRLGEVALVDRGSRIGLTQRTYFNTLLDENAVAHMAFGYGFPEARTGEPGKRSRRGLNDSNVHLDVMVGSDELEATGLARGGKRVPLIRDGAWQI
jgi:aminopeptidase